MNKITRVVLYSNYINTFRGNRCHTYYTNNMTDSSRLRLNDVLTVWSETGKLKSRPYVGQFWCLNSLYVVNAPKRNKTEMESSVQKVSAIKHYPEYGPENPFYCRSCGLALSGETTPCPICQACKQSVPVFTEDNYAGDYQADQRLNSVSELRPGKLYLLRMPKHRIYLILVTKLVWRETKDDAGLLSSYYRIADPENLSRAPRNVNRFEFVLRDNVELSSAWAWEIYEARRA